MVDTDNSIEEEIKERIAAGNRAYHVHKNRVYHVHKNRAYHVHKNRACHVHKNRAYHVHKKLFSSKLMSQNVKLQLYNTLIRPTVTYASETWVLKENMTNKLMTFKRKIMRKIFGRTRTNDGYWRIKTNQEINYILKGQNIIGFIKKTKIKLVRPW